MAINIIFDWSGVIKDALVGHLWVVNRMFEKYGVATLSVEDFRESWVEPYLNFYQKYVPGMTLEEEQKLYKEGVLDKNYPSSTVFEGMVELIKLAKDKGNYVAVITSDFPETIFPEINKFGLEGVFDDVVTNIHDKSEALGDLILKKGLGADNTYIVGDSSNEIIAGQKNKIKSIFVTWGLMSETNLKQNKPNYIVHDIAELKKTLNI